MAGRLGDDVTMLCGVSASIYEIKAVQSRQHKFYPECERSEVTNCYVNVDVSAMLGELLLGFLQIVHIFVLKAWFWASKMRCIK